MPVGTRGPHALVVETGSGARGPVFEFGSNIWVI